MTITLLNKPTVIPETYIQYPDMPPPSIVYGGLWQALFDGEGIFFRTGGGEALPFGGGIQQSAVGPHKHSMTFRRTNKERNSTPTVLSYDENRRGWITYQTTPDGEGISIETRPRNRTIRVWARIQGNL